MTIETDLFREYATSGAFTMSLSRNQVQAMSLCSGGANEWFTALQVLERKGMVARLGPDGRHVRLTAPGLHALALCRLAGLTNGADDELSRELADLHRQVDQLMCANQDLAEKNWSLSARLEESELTVRTLAAERDGGHWQPPIVRLRDQHPGVPTADLVAGRTNPKGTPHG